MIDWALVKPDSCRKQDSACRTSSDLPKHQLILRGVDSRPSLRIWRGRAADAQKLLTEQARKTQPVGPQAAEPPVFTEGTRLVFVGGFGSLLQLMIGLIEQLLGF